MKTIAIYGASDDLVEFEGVKYARDTRGADVHEQEDDSYPEGPRGSETAEFPADLGHGEFLICDCITVVAHCVRGRWNFEVGYPSRGGYSPEWPIRVMPSPDVSYSARVEIDCPSDETEVLRVK